ncbi:hypothetical protein ABBQ32_011868 [Trebouxia sp. C0010 RCD-2024]
MSPTNAESLIASKQLGQAAAGLALHSPWQRPARQTLSGTEPPWLGSKPGLPQCDAELTDACQQLAKAAADHAQCRASLQQALTEISTQHFASWGDAANAVATAGHTNASQHEETSFPTACCAALLQAAEASQAEDMRAYQAEHADGRIDGNPEEMADACQQLAEAMSAHASQQEQLQRLLQQQLASTPSQAPSPVSTAQHVPSQPGRHDKAATTAFDKAVARSKPGVRMIQHCSAADTSAWPPGPQQPFKGHLMQATVPSGRSAKGLMSRVGQSKTATYRSAQQRQSSNGTLVQAKLTAGHQKAGIAGVVCAGSSSLLHSAPVPEQKELKPQKQGSTTSHAVPDDTAEAVAHATKDLASNAPAPMTHEDAGFGVSVVAAGDEAEPSFGAVHAMLAALQLPSVEAASLWDDTLPHTCDLLKECPALCASQEPLEDRSSASAALTVGAAFQILNLDMEYSQQRAPPSSAACRPVSHLAKLQAIKVVLQARRKQGLRELQQCHQRLKDVQHQLASQQVLLAPHGSGCGGPAPAGVPQTMWIGGTASQKDSKHRQLQEAVPDSHVRHPHAGGDAWAGSEYKVRLLAALLTKLHAKLGLLAMRHNSAMAPHTRQLLEQVEAR